jgi:hypothetical protein
MLLPPPQAVHNNIRDNRVEANVEISREVLGLINRVSVVD